jgi:hypothetical protein
VNFDIFFIDCRFAPDDEEVQLGRKPVSHTHAQGSENLGPAIERDARGVKMPERSLVNQRPSGVTQAAREIRRARP